MINRRNFIQVGALAAVGAYSLGLTGKVFGQKSIADDSFIIPSGILGDPVLTFSSEHFEPFINTTFQIKNPLLLPRRTVDLQLIQVKKTESKFNKEEGIRGNSYSLLFKAERPSAVRIEQSIYEFSHGGLGKFSLFIAPVLPEPNIYEAVINHLSR